MTRKYHEPVMLTESVDALVTDPNGTYVDATFGGGGHSGEILARLKNGKLYAFDQDEDSIQNTIDDKRFMLIRSNFRYIQNFLAYHRALPVTGVLADLGISSHQVDTAGRGFSTRFDAELDMRMNRESALTARHVVNEYPEEKLREVLREYGELREAGSLANRIVRSRVASPISSTKALTGILEPEAERGHEQQFFAKIFQALRIEVNQEMEALKEMLRQCAEVLMEKGRLVVISYHSLEDRLVKNFIAKGNFSGHVEHDLIFGHASTGKLRPVNKKPMEPSEEEVSRNPRARSAKMRVAEKK